MDRVTERGSLAIFVVVGVILLVLTGGAVYFAKQRATAPAQSEIAKTNTQESQSKPQKDDANSSAPKENQNQEPNQSESQSTSPQEENNSDPSDSQASTDNDQSSTSSHQPREVAETGIADQLFITIGSLGGLTYAATRYLQSRRLLRNRWY